MRFISTYIIIIITIIIIIIIFIIIIIIIIMKYIIYRNISKKLRKPRALSRNWKLIVRTEIKRLIVCVHITSDWPVSISLSLSWKRELKKYIEKIRNADKQLLVFVYL